MSTSNADYDALVEAIYAAATALDLWPAALERLAEYVGGAGSMLAFCDLKGPGSFIVTSRLPDEIVPLYLDRYTNNAWSAGLAKAPPNRPIFANSLVDTAQLRRTAFHADILAPAGIADMLATGHPGLTQSGGTGGISVTLTPAHEDQRDEMVGRLRRLVPHLARAVDLSLDIGRRTDEGHAAAIILEALGGPALLLGADGRVARMNHAAEQLLKTCDGLRLGPLSGQPLVAALGDETRRLARLFRRCLPLEGGGQPGAVRVTRPSGRPAFLIVATPLPAARSGTWGLAQQQTCALIQIVDPAASLDHQAALLGEATGLTMAQTRTAALVGTGLSVPRVAALLRLSPTTVRSHLRDCFERTGTHSQAELARLLASLPTRPFSLPQSARSHNAASLDMTSKKPSSSPR